MPNPATQALASAFSVLLASSGEPLTLERTPPVKNLAALVDRTPLHKKPNHPHAHLATDERQTVIEFFDAALRVPPVVGETFLDSAGVHHRIQRSQVMDGYLRRCHCEASA